MKVKKNDKVKVLYGKDSGKVARVLKVLPARDMVMVENVNMSKKHIKGDGAKKTSEIVTIVKPVMISKVMVVCPLCNKSTRVKNGVKGRVCVKCGKIIDTAVEKKTTTKSPEKVKENVDKK